jgi:glycine/D-amino acid oxidase-like deaminating enzyme
MSGAHLAAGWSSEPYWWQAVPRETAAPPAATLPERVDVAIVGAGFTGLSAALELARAGRSTLVLDAGPPGFGASSRNGGMVGHGHRVAYDDLVEKYGEGAADDLIREGLNALAFTTGLIEREGIGCQFQRTGRFRAAWRPEHYDRMARELDRQKRRLGINAGVVPRAEQDAEIGTGRYHGGLIYHGHGGLHPALFHQGLLERARAAGASVVGFTRVEGLARDGSGFAIRTSRGRLTAKAVIVATNGYGDRAAGAVGRQVAAIPSFIIATERLGQNRVRSLIPNGRMIVESRAAHCYYRPSPDGERILFGARAALHMVGPERAARRNRAYLVGLFPQLRDVELTHSWAGWVAFTRSFLPVLGVRDGIHYAMGYCGSGVAMAPYLGYRIAHKLLGDAECRTAFDDLPFRTWPLHAALPLARPLAGLWHRAKDWRDG